MRNSPHVWATFFSLEKGEHFFIGKTLFVKHNWMVGDKVGLGGSRYVAPWRRVRTTQPVKGSKSHPIPGTMTGRRVNSQVNVSCGGGGGGPTPLDGVTACIGGHRITATECRESMANQPAPLILADNAKYLGMEISPSVLARDIKDYGIHTGEPARIQAEIGAPNPTGEPIRGTELNDAR